MTDAPRIYEAEYYKLLHDMEGKHWWSRGMRAAAGALLDSVITARGESLRILDAGCGTGVLLEWLERYPHARIYGVDISTDALRYCRDRGRTLICRSSVASLPFPAGTFDLITCNDVLQHVPSQDSTVLSEMHRLLKPGGFLYLRTNAPQRWAPLQDSAHEYVRYSPDMVEQKAASAGFQILRSSFGNALPSLLADFRNLLQSRKNKSHSHDAHGYSGLQMHNPPLGLNSILYLYLRLEALLLRRSAARIPFGHSLHFLLQRNIETVEKT